MSRLYYFVLLTLVALSYTSLPVTIFGAEPTLEKDWFAGAWDLDYQALILRSDETKVKTDRGTEFSEYVLTFVVQARFIVEKDRVVTFVDLADPLKSKPANEKGGKVVFEHRRGQFFHRAQWKSAEGAASDYAFTSAGVLKGSGQFDAKSLALNLEWTTLDGRGTSGGKRIDVPVGMHTWKSKWTLKPETPPKSDLAGVTTPKLLLAAARSTPMPQQLAGCPPLPLLERVSIVRAPTADLEVKAQHAADQDPASKIRTLSVTVKNLGPDDSQQTVLGVVLPEDAVFISSKEARPITANGEVLKYNLAKLASGASVKLDIRLEYKAAPPDAKETPATLVQAFGAAYDPNQANNGHLETVHPAAKPVKKP